MSVKVAPGSLVLNDIVDILQGHFMSTVAAVTNINPSIDK